jgi:hypothetical protein
LYSSVNFGRLKYFAFFLRHFDQAIIPTSIKGPYRGKGFAGFYAENRNGTAIAIQIIAAA